MSKMLRMSEEQYAGMQKPKQSKYRNHKTDGYDSKKEAKRATELKILLDSGLISDLKEQVPFLLLPSQRRSDGVAERPSKYIADFVYIENGQMVVEDTKGFRTADYILKRKMMLFFHKITIKEI